MSDDKTWVDGLGTLTEAGEEKIKNGLGVLQTAILMNNIEKGWAQSNPTDGSPIQRPVSEHTSLIMTELAEVFEAYRNGEPKLWFEARDVKGFVGDQHWEGPPTITDGDGNVVRGKPQGMASELADVIIRVFDFAEEHDLDVIRAVILKHKYNQTRPYRHGGKVA